jgi:hypothetical protein
MTSTQDLGWLLANFADRVPGVAHAIAVSPTGCCSQPPATCRETVPTNSPRFPRGW